MLVELYIGQELEKLENCGYVKNQKCILGEIKIIFHNLLKILFWWNKKVAGTSFIICFSWLKFDACVEKIDLAKLKSFSMYTFQ